MILHHIREWSSSRDHNPENLVLLCLEHHAQAHRKGGIEQNLTPDMSRGMKVKWEEAVKSLDSRSILESGRNPAFHWWWFNHQRILEMARANGIDFRSIGSFCTAKRHADLEDNGSLGLATHSRDYLYQGGDGIYLSQFMEKILNSVLARTPVFDISNDMDRSTLKHVVQQGDLLLVRGRHFFKVLEKRSTGPGQASSVTRKVNGIEVAFIIDRWEAVSNSSFHGWLKGTQSASSLVRVVSLEENSGILQINCTGLAIGGQMPGLETRSYFKGNCPIQRYQDDSVADEDWPE